MNWARQIHLKNPAELKIMREAGRINASVLAATRELIATRCFHSGPQRGC